MSNMSDFSQMPSGAPEGVIPATEITVGSVEARRPFGRRMAAVIGALGITVGGAAATANVVSNDAPQERAAGWQPIDQESFHYCDKDNASWSITLTGIGEDGKDYDVDVVPGSVSPEDAKIEDGDYNYASVIGTWPLSVESGTVSARFVYDGAPNHGPLDGSATYNRPPGCEPEATTTTVAPTTTEAATTTVAPTTTEAATTTVAPTTTAITIPTGS